MTKRKDVSLAVLTGGQGEVYASRGIPGRRA